MEWVLNSEYVIKCQTLSDKWADCETWSRVVGQQSQILHSPAGKITGGVNVFNDSNRDI